MSSKISQCDLAPSRGGANTSISREDGVESAKPSTTISKLPRWPEAARIVPLAIGKSATRGGMTLTGRLSSTVTSRWSFRRSSGRDCLLVAAVDQDNTGAFQTDEWHVRIGFGRGGDQCGHLRPGIRRLVGPAGGFAYVDERNISGADFAGRLSEKRLFLGAADDKRLTFRDRGTKAFELGAAELSSGFDTRAGATSPHGVRVDWHRVLTRAKQNVWQVFGHGLIKGKQRGISLPHRVRNNYSASVSHVLQDTLPFMKTWQTSVEVRK